MKKIISVVCLICILGVNISLPFPAFSAGGCGYCGRFFIFSDSNPYGECQARMFACWDAAPGEMDSCMCQAERDLDLKYTAEYLMFHELVFWIGLLTQASGVSFLRMPGLTPPGLQFLDPKRREYLLSRNARAHEQVGAVFGGYPAPAAVKAVVTLSRLADERTPASQRAAEWAIDNLPDGNAKTGLKLLSAWKKYWKTVTPE